MHFSQLDNQRLANQLSGNRFQVTYRLEGDYAAARAKANDICAEQTVEFPVGLLPAGDIPGQVLGRIEDMTQASENAWNATISYADEIAAGEFTQLLNVVFGNISIKPGIQVVDIILSQGVLGFLSGPQFGIRGIREQIGVWDRPPLFTALKPMGLSPGDLADLAGRFALGGVDIIKDDHGLSNQVFAPFRERVARCADAVKEANARTGHNAIYVPNVTGPVERILERAHEARELGAGGLLVAPGLTGLDTMRALADAQVGLPVFAHPAFIGSYAVNPQGISVRVLFGTLIRLAGADATIFPNYGGRFSLSVEDCLGIAQAGKAPMGRLKPIFPSPAGGMELKNIPDIVEKYGKDVLALVGGGLFSAGSDIVQNCQLFLDVLQDK